jgi:hypothetical protein
MLLPAAALLDLPCCFHLLRHHCICYVAPTCCNTSASALLLPSTTAPLCLIYVASTCCNTTASSTVSIRCSTIGSTLLPLSIAAPLQVALLLPPVAARLHLPCFHVLQHHCLFSVASICSNITASLLLPPILQQPIMCYATFVAAPLHLLCCYHLIHLLHDHCIWSAASTCWSTIWCTIAFALLLPPAVAPLFHLCCFHLLHHLQLLEHYCDRSALLLSPTTSPLLVLCCFHLFQHHFLFFVASNCCSTTSSSLLLPPAAALVIVSSLLLHLRQN